MVWPGHVLNQSHHTTFFEILKEKIAGLLFPAHGRI
jgi:hypothetical protein